MPDAAVSPGPASADRRPLVGRRVVVCRSEDDAAPLLEGLRRLGAEPLLVPLVARAGPADGGAALRAALDRLDTYAWLAVTSATGVGAVVEALAGRALPPGLQVAAVGPATAEACRRAGLPVDLVAPVATAADLARAFPPPTSGSARPVVLAPLAELAGDDLACGLRARGYRVDRVDAYRLVDPPADLAHGGPGVTGEALAGSDAVLFSAPSVVDRYLRHFGPESVPPLVVCIGPRTADRARSRGLEPVVVAAEHTTAGLLVAVQACLARAGNG